MNTKPRKRLGILIFDEVEVLDFCGPYEVFSIARLNPERHREEPSPFEVLLVAEKEGPVAATGGMRVLPDRTFADCPPLDLLCVPGGWGTRREIDNPALIEWIGKRAGEAELILSVCTGALLLGKAGLLDGKRATTHHKSFDWLRNTVPSATVEESLRVVDEGALITSGGISAGIDMALYVVERYFGTETARAAAERMEYRRA